MCNRDDNLLLNKGANTYNSTTAQTQTKLEILVNKYLNREIVGLSLSFLEIVFPSFLHSQERGGERETKRKRERKRERERQREDAIKA